jgi:hypothetical protein
VRKSKIIFLSGIRVSIVGRSQPKGIKFKMKECELRSGVKWPGKFRHKKRKMLNQRGIQ